MAVIHYEKILRLRYHTQNPLVRPLSDSYRVGNDDLVQPIIFAKKLCLLYRFYEIIIPQDDKFAERTR